MLLLHPVPTSADAGPDLCTLCPDLCTLHPDLWTLCLWCFPSFNWCKYSTCTGGGCHQLQLALVVLFPSATSADSPLAHVVASPSATCTGGAFSSSHWRKYCICTRATCTVWWWSVVVYIYIYKYVSQLVNILYTIHYIIHYITYITLPLYFATCNCTSVYLQMCICLVCNA